MNEYLAAEQRQQAAMDAHLAEKDAFYDAHAHEHWAQQWQAVAVLLARDLRTVADDLQAEIEASYGGTQDRYPIQKRRYLRDLASVRRAGDTLQLFQMKLQQQEADDHARLARQSRSQDQGTGGEGEQRLANGGGEPAEGRGSAEGIGETNGEGQRTQPDDTRTATE